MPQKHAEEIFVKGLQAFSNGHEYLAMVCFECAADLDNNPLYWSYLAYCLAKVRGQYREALALCEEALERDPANAIHYVNLGRIYELCNQKEKALETLRKGLHHQRNNEVYRALERLGIRSEPVFPFLKRGNPLNKYCGLLLKKVGYR